MLPEMPLLQVDVLTGGPWGTLDQADTALTEVLKDSCLEAAWRSAVLEEASMLAIDDEWVN